MSNKNKKGKEAPAELDIAQPELVSPADKYSKPKTVLDKFLIFQCVSTIRT